MRFESPSKRFPGHVILPDYLNIRQVKAFEQSLLSPEKLQEALENPEKLVPVSIGLERRLPAVLECVSEWNLQGVPPKPNIETFPASPPEEVANLIQAIHSELNNIYRGETALPNE